MAKKKHRNFDINKQVALIHFRHQDGSWDFKIGTVGNLEENKMKLLLQGKTDISIPYFDNPDVAKNMMK